MYILTIVDDTEPWVIAIAVIIPVVIILIIVVILAWRYKKKRDLYGDAGGNILYQSAPNDLSRGSYSRPRNTQQRATTYGSYAYTSEYAQSKVHHNPLYGKTGPSMYGEVGGVYQTPTIKRVASLPRQSHQPASLPRQVGSLPRQLGDVPQQGRSLPRQPGSFPQQSSGFPRQPGSLPRRNSSLSRQTGSFPRQNSGQPRQAGSLPRRVGSVARERESDYAQSHYARPSQPVPRY